TVGVRVLTSPEDQELAMWSGTRRLLLLAAPAARRDAERRLRARPALVAARPPLPTVAELADDCAAAAADRVIATHGGPAWDEEAFAELAAGARARLVPLAVGAAGRAGELVAVAARLEQRLDGIRAPALATAVEDMREQLHRLVRPGFVRASGLARLADIGRYLEGIRVRLDKLGERAVRDREDTSRIRALEAAYAEAVDGLPPARRRDPAVVQLRWDLEELRISLFAQVVGTRRPVSERRIRRALADIA